MQAGTRGKTAFVFAGGGSFGALQVGMLHALVEYGVQPDFVVGASALVGANTTEPRETKASRPLCIKSRCLSRGLSATRLACSLPVFT